MPNELNLFIGTVEAHARADRSGAFAGAFIVCERINKASEAIAIKLYAPRAPRSLADATNMRCVNVIYPRVKRTFRFVCACEGLPCTVAFVHNAPTYLIKQGHAAVFTVVLIKFTISVTTCTR